MSLISSLEAGRAAKSLQPKAREYVTRHGDADFQIVVSYSTPTSFHHRFRSARKNVIHYPDEDYSFI
jgi:sarcosine oxidase gamma subunit